MPAFQAPQRDYSFLLFEALDAERHWAALADSVEVDRALAEAVIDAADKLAVSEFLPLNQPGDAEGCRFEQGEVSTPEGFRAAYAAYAEGGWGGLAGEPEFGGQGMPKMLTVAVEEIFFAANPALFLYPALSSGAALLLASHGSRAIREQWLPPLYAGRYTGTMCLTEPHAGSDLGLLRTRAEPQDDGSYRLTGTKIFITGGEHDLSENIVHLVLARLPDAPAGTRGISLFLVPKYLPAADDAEGVGTGARNEVTAGAIEHKMGIRGSATCVMNFDGAQGWLVGEPNRGLAAMFTMMNYERLSIGLQGLAAGEIAYQNALGYARERLQGRAPDREQGSGEPADALLTHPDVQRMLLIQKAYAEGGRAFAAWLGLQLDLARHSDDRARKQEAEALVAFLTPVAKAYFTDRGHDCTVLAQQVFGGHGYVTEWGMEQLVRDVRIAQIYEGTNGIQAMDLADRKTARDAGRLAGIYAQVVAAFLEGPDCPADWRKPLEQALVRFREATDAIVEGSRSDPAWAGAVACDYLELTGLLSYGWLWALMAGRAATALADGGEAASFYRAKVATADFFRKRLLPEIEPLTQRIVLGADGLDPAAFAGDA